MNSKYGEAILNQHYKQILSSIDKAAFERTFKNDDDKYSGVFLTYPFPAYESAKTKIMIVGRETAGWNTDTKTEKNTIKRIIDKNQSGELEHVIEESLERYSWHLKDKEDGEVKTKHTSAFRRFFMSVAKQVGVEQEGIIYANLLAWDYNKRSPLTKRPAQEREQIIDISIQLLAEQIRFYQPQHIIFATGVSVDRVIKKLIEKLSQTHLGGYKKISVEPRKLWHFKMNQYKCYRIAHPRVNSNEHPQFRQKVIDMIKADNQK